MAAPATPKTDPPSAPSEQHIVERICYWREQLLQSKESTSQAGPLRREEIRAALDDWLEQLCQLKQLWWFKEGE